MKSIKITPVRRIVQLLVFSSLITFPLMSRYSHYLSARQLDNVIEGFKGSVQSVSLKTTDFFMRLGLPKEEDGVKGRRPRKTVLNRTKNFYGSPWSARLFGVSLTDLLAGAESLFASHSFKLVLFIGLLIPIIVTLLFGRVYCSWICPMGVLTWLSGKLRSVLKFLEIKPQSIPFWKGNKYILLGVGLFLVLLMGIPLLHFIYPPAVFSQQGHGLVMALFDEAESGRMGWTWIGLSSGSIFLLSILIIETFFSPSLWCRSLCPGGALYALLGKARILRVRREKTECTDCTICDTKCPMGLFPMKDKTGMECDNCGVCVDVCPTNTLYFKWSLNSDGFSKESLQKKGCSK